jgi:ribosomal protein L11 methyltransferase
MPYHEFTIHIGTTARQPVIQRLMDLGCLGLVEQDDSITAYLPGTADPAGISAELSMMQALLRATDPGNEFRFTHAMLPDQDWNEEWKKGFVPIDLGKRFTILPPWEAPKPGRSNIIVDPGQAFGTGHHETTRSCLVLLEKYSLTSKRERCLDVGTGTGILAIAASMLGFREVVAVDTDQLAIDATKKNAELNKISGIDVHLGGIEEASGRFDMITANILATILISLAPMLAERLREDGVLILSGILAGQDEEVLAAMQQFGLRCKEVFPDAKWRSLVVGRI